MNPFGSLRRSLAGILTAAIMTSPLAGLPQNAAAQEAEPLDQCLNVYDYDLTEFKQDAINLFNENRDSEIKHPFIQSDCIAPNGQVVKVSVDYPLVVEANGDTVLHDAVYSPTKEEMQAMVAQTEQPTKKCYDLIKQDYSQLTAEAKEAFRREEELSHPYASGTCVDELGNVRDFTVDFPVISKSDGTQSLRGPVFEPTEAELIAQMPTKYIQSYEVPVSHEDRTVVTTQEERDNGATVRMFVIGAVVVAVVVIGVIVTRRLFKATPQAERLAARAEGRTVRVVEASAAREAMERTMDLPKTVDLELLGVRGIEGGRYGTIAAGVPLDYLPSHAVRYIDRRTGNVYFAQRDPESGLLFWFWADRRFSEPYWMQGTYWSRNYHSARWDYRPEYNPWAYRGTDRTSGGIEMNGGYRGGMRTSTDGLQGQARASQVGTVRTGSGSPAVSVEQVTAAAREAAAQRAPEVAVRRTPVREQIPTAAPRQQTSASVQRSADLGLRPGNSGVRAAQAKPAESNSGGFFNNVRQPEPVKPVPVAKPVVQAPPRVETPVLARRPAPAQQAAPVIQPKPVEPVRRVESAPLASRPATPSTPAVKPATPAAATPAAAPRPGGSGFRRT